MQKQIDSLRRETQASTGLLLSQQAIGTLEQTLIYMKNTLAADAVDEPAVALADAVDASAFAGETFDSTDATVSVSVS